MKIAFITGITGQDGSYFPGYLLYLEYEVHGVLYAELRWKIQLIIYGESCRLEIV